ncbi:hypothetical protein F4679DRAFT_580128 [Xylaria curta]|nr:hypothetical protein F4679DRAFT_580128 [Xylaria curta]
MEFIEGVGVDQILQGDDARIMKKDLYTRTLEEEEKEVLGDDIREDEKPSVLLKECQKQGHQWFHFILLRGFNGPTCAPFTKLLEETADWNELVYAIPEDKNEAFVQKKVADLERYKTQLADLQQMYNVSLVGGSKDMVVFLEENLRSIGIDKRRHQWRAWKCFSR